MTGYYRIVCDQCGEKFVYDDADDKQALGWIEVWSGPGEQKDFCSQGCLVDFYNGKEEEDE